MMIEAELGQRVLFFSLLTATLVTLLYILFSTLVSRRSSDPFLKFCCACLLLLHLPSLSFLTATRHLVWINIYDFIKNLLASFIVFIFIDYYSDLMTADVETQARLDAEISKFIFSRWILSILELGFQIFSSFSSCKDSVSFLCYQFGRLYSIWALVLVGKLYPCLLLGDALINVHVELEDDIAHMGWQCCYMLGMIVLFPLSKAILLLDVSDWTLSCILTTELLILAWMFVFAFQITIRLRHFDLIDYERIEGVPCPSPLLESLAMPSPNASASASANASANASPVSRLHVHAVRESRQQRALLPASEWSSYYHLPDMRRVLFFCRSWMATYYQSLHIKVSRALRSFRPPFGMSPNDDFSDDATSVSSSLLQSYHSSSTESLTSRVKIETADNVDDFEIISISSL